MADTAPARDGTSETTSAKPHLLAVSSVLLSQPAATVDVFPYPTFAESVETAEGDEGGEEDEEDGEDDDGCHQHWLDMALSAPLARSYNAFGLTALADATSALSALRAAHRSVVDSQQLTSAGWQSVKQQTRHHLIHEHITPIQQRHPPSAALIATLDAQDSHTSNSPHACNTCTTTHSSARLTLCNVSAVCVAHHCTTQELS